MKAFALILLALTPSLADASEFVFRDTFRAFVQVRSLEEKARIGQERPDLEDGDRVSLLRQTSSELAKARSEFQALQLSADFTAWEKAVVKRESKRADDKTALDFLSRNFGPTARGWSAVEWQCAGEWFGRAVQDSFLKITFAMEEVAGVPATGTGTLLWVTDPFSRFLSKDEATRERTARAAVTAGLQKQGYAVEELEVPAFTHLDEQAEELSLALESRLDKGAVTLVSGGHGSTVLIRTLDLHPRLLANAAIRGWVNVNGKLFGELAAGRMPASVSRADRPLADARLDLLPLREERLVPQTPLSPKFPVVNVVSLSGAARPGTSLRDSLVPEGKTLYLKNGDAFTALGVVLPALGARAPSGQRDLASESSL